MNPFRLNDAGGLDFLDRDRHLQRLRNLAGIEQARRPEKRYPARVNPADMMTDAQFKMHFRVDKETALTLVDLLGLTRPNVDWGSPLHPVQVLCLTLNHFAGGHFQRVTGYCGDCSQSSAHRAIQFVRDRILSLQEEYIRMPTLVERQETAAFMHEKYHLPGFAYGVDGMFAKFDEKIRRIPVGPGFPNAQAFFTRKGFYGMTVLIVGDHRYLIRGMDADWPGGAHDAVVWSFSLVKVLVEENREHLLAGDSAFPISDVLVKPYSNQDALDDPRKRLFNLRHSGLRTEMTENIYAMLKRHWHILKHMGEDYTRAKKTIWATAILHNMLIGLNDDLPPLGDDEDDDGGDNNDGGDGTAPAEPYTIVEDTASR